MMRIMTVYRRMPRISSKTSRSPNLYRQRMLEKMKQWYFVKVTVPVKEVTKVLPDGTGEAYPEKHVGRSIKSINY